MLAHGQPFHVEPAAGTGHEPIIASSRSAHPLPPTRIMSRVMSQVMSQVMAQRRWGLSTGPMARCNLTRDVKVNYP